MTQEELNKIIENHQHWLNEDCKGWEMMRGDLSGSDLSGCNLSGSNLSGCNLSDSNLSGSDLRYSDLSGSNLRDSNLSGSNLRGSDLSGCNLSGCNLSGSNLSGLKHDEYTAFYDLQCPEEGDFIAFKKAFKKIVKLRIPAEARRSSATTRKCRAEFADVLEILNADKTKSDVSEVPSNYNNEVIYKVGERVTADSWDEDRWNECSHGIHFFITFDEAVNY
jgi:uncharacterized protein YjbI with pentapeptide repeats